MPYWEYNIKRRTMMGDLYEKLLGARSLAKQALFLDSFP